MATASSQAATCIEPASASEWTATDAMPSLRKVRAMRQAISPRLAMRTLLNMRLSCGGRVPDQEPDGGGIVGVAGIVELGAIGNKAEDVHFGAHLHVLARRRH